MRFPPLLPRCQLEKIGYLKSFPHLAGTIFSFDGGEAGAAEQEERAARHEDWSEFQTMTDLVLLPAACYPVYPAIAERGAAAARAASTVDTGGPRSSATSRPAIRRGCRCSTCARSSGIGEPEASRTWRDRWRDRAVELLRGARASTPTFEVASDPFFGRARADARREPARAGAEVRAPGR